MNLPSATEVKKQLTGGKEEARSNRNGKDPRNQLITYLGKMEKIIKGQSLLPKDLIDQHNSLIKQTKEKIVEALG